MDPLRLLVLLSIKHNINISLSGSATSLGYLTKSLMPSPSFRTHVSGQWLPRLKKDPLPSHLKRSRRTQSGDWHELPTVSMSFQAWRFRQGQTLVIACSTSPVCPVTAMHDYFLTARLRGPLYFFQSVRLLTRSAVVNLIRDDARQVGLPSLKGYRFRIGVASMQPPRACQAG